MKKIIGVMFLLLSFSIGAYGEMIDEGYVGLIFDNFDKYDEKEKLQNAELLDVFFTSDFTLDLLYKEIVRNKSASLEAYGISESDLKRNIDALKTWSVMDRKALIAAGVSGDQTIVYDLNEKNNGSVKKSPFIQKAKEADPKLKKDFLDVKNHWSQENVNFLSDRGIISGKSKTSFAPDDNILKAEIVKLVINLVVEDENQLPTYTGNVTDIKSGAWYEDAMKQAYALEIIKKDFSNLLKPETFATREEVVDIIVNSISAIGIEVDSDLKIYKGSFTDYKDLSPEFKESMTIAINLGIIGGKGNNDIAPKALITRGETATVVKRLYDYIINNI